MTLRPVLPPARLLLCGLLIGVPSWAGAVLPPTPVPPSAPPPPQPAAPLPAIGSVPPVPPVPPPIMVPTRPPPPPGPLQVAPDAPGTTTPIAGGLRLTFGAGDVRLNPASADALRALAKAAPAEADITVTAHAAGTADDPSSARRLSLSRALAVRGILIAEGISSARILVRALGASAPASAGEPADRVDVTTGPTARPAK